jgi:hypothetical protein
LHRERAVRRSEDLVAGAKFRDARADGLDLAREIGAGDSLFGRLVKRMCRAQPAARADFLTSAFATRVAGPPADGRPAPVGLIYRIRD